MSRYYTETAVKGVVEILRQTVNTEIGYVQTELASLGSAVTLPHVEHLFSYKRREPLASACEVEVYEDSAASFPRLSDVNTNPGGSNGRQAMSNTSVPVMVRLTLVNRDGSDPGQMVDRTRRIASALLRVLWDNAAAHRSYCPTIQVIAPQYVDVNPPDSLLVDGNEATICQAAIRCQVEITESCSGETTSNPTLVFPKPALQFPGDGPA